MEVSLAARDQWAEVALAIHERLWKARPAMSGKVSDLRAEVVKYLIGACNTKLLKDAPHDIHRKVKLTADLKNSENQLMTGGLIEGTRFGNKERFLRCDGAAFDFSMTVRQTGEMIELLAYDFEIRLPEGFGPSFLRFDLNQPGHDNEKIGLRSHVHPGVNEDQLMLPAPVMSPLEILRLFVHHLQRPVRKRSDHQDF